MTVFAGMSGLVFALPALAHPGHGEATLAQGLAHPFSGADHMLAMIAVGLWASLRGGKALWAWPAAFVAAMLAGFALGQTAPGVPLVEPMIMASVIVLGALTAANARAPTSLGVVLIALFGLAHGYAHGSEAPAGSGLDFPLGFAVSTAALHLTGLATGLGLNRLNRPAVVRLLGAGAVLGGLALVLAQ
jgi:urease accessory protein